MNTIWQSYRMELYRFILKRVRDEAAAEDLVHDVLLKAYSRRQELRDPGKLRPWLYQMTRNAVIDYYRSRPAPAPLPEHLAGTASEPDDGAVRELARCCLVPFLDGLPPRYGQALALADLEGLTQREVASRLGLSLAGAKSRVQRARRMLAEALLECCRIERDRRGAVMDYECRRGCDPCC